MEIEPSQMVNVAILAIIVGFAWHHSESLGECLTILCIILFLLCILGLAFSLSIIGTVVILIGYFVYTICLKIRYWIRKRGRRAG